MALHGKRGDLSPLMERLLGFAFTQASAVYVEDSEDVVRDEGASMKGLIPSNTLRASPRSIVETSIVGLWMILLLDSAVWSSRISFYL